MRFMVGCGLVVLGILYWHASALSLPGLGRRLTHPQAVSWIVAAFVGAGIFLDGTAFAPENAASLHSGIIGGALIALLTVPGWLGLDLLARRARPASIRHSTRSADEGSAPHFNKDANP